MTFAALVFLVLSSGIAVAVASVVSARAAYRAAAALERIAAALQQEDVVPQPPTCAHANTEPAPDATFTNQTRRCADCQEPV